MSINAFFNLIRYKSYLKNLLIFVALFFNYEEWNIASFIDLIFALIFFSFLSSSIYIINDLLDLKIDKTHKLKKFRPIANGEITKKNAISIASTLAIFSSFYFYFFTNHLVFILILSYFILNIFYSFIFKKIKYLDVLSVTYGFLVRIYIGALITSISVSLFFAVQVFLFSLFILVCKRREYFYSFEQTVSSNYTLRELNNISKLLFIANILNYFNYLFNGVKFIDSFCLEISLIIFIILITRYFQIVLKNKLFDPIYIYLNDKYLIIFSCVYVLNFIFGYYGFY